MKGLKISERIGKCSATTKQFLPVILLITVAFHQIYLSKFHQLTPWKGGGFGMFSSTELGSARFVRVFVSAPDRSEEILIPESLENSALRASTYPSNALLHDLACGVFKREKRKQNPVDTIRIDVWRTRYDPGTLKPEEEKFLDYVFKVDQAGC